MFALYSIKKKFIKPLKNIFMIRLIIFEIKYRFFNNFCSEILLNLRNKL